MIPRTPDILALGPQESRIYTLQLTNGCCLTSTPLIDQAGEDIKLLTPGLAGLEWLYSCRVSAPTAGQPSIAGAAGHVGSWAIRRELTSRSPVKQLLGVRRTIVNSIPRTGKRICPRVPTSGLLVLQEILLCWLNLL